MFSRNDSTQDPINTLFPISEDSFWAVITIFIISPIPLFGVLAIYLAIMLGKGFSSGVGEFRQPVEGKVSLKLGERFRSSIGDFCQAVKNKISLVLGERFGGGVREVGRTVGDAGSVKTETVQVKISLMLGESFHSGIGECG